MQSVQKLTVFGIALCLGLALKPSMHSQEKVASAGVSGAVISAGTGQPISGAEVQLWKQGEYTQQDGTKALVAAPFKTARTNDIGRFAFSELEAGKYWLEANASGFARNAFGQQTSNLPRQRTGKTTLFELSATQPSRDIEIRLVRLGVITGRIVDEKGRPVPKIAVVAQPISYNEDGRVVPWLGDVKDETDDRGQFRLYDLPPGRYYVLAGAAPPGGGIVTPFLTLKREHYLWTYYPGTTKEQDATVIRIQDGAEVSKTDFSLARATQFFTIRGHAIDSATGRTPTNAIQANVCLPNGSVTAGSEALADQGPANTADGTFEFPNLIPGLYTLMVMPAAGPPTGVLRSYVDVSSRDVNDLLLTNPAGVSLAGRLLMDGNALPVSAELSDIRLQLRWALPVYCAAVGAARSLTTQTPNPDGTFRIPNVMPGMYRLRVAGLPQNYYVETARWDRSDIPSDGFRFLGNPGGDIEVMLNPNGAQIDGTVQDARRVASRAQVVIVPETQSRVDLYKTAATDNTGHFVIHGVPPGRYRVFAFENLEPFAYFAPDFLKDYEKNGAEVSLSGAARLTVQLNVISAEP